MGSVTGQPVPRILYEDNHLLVALKQPGVLSQADNSASADMLTLLREDIRVRYAKPGNVYLGLVHRLDQPVGGVMVFARTSKAAARLSEQIRQHQMEKYYLAVVTGKPDTAADCLQDNLVKDRRRNLVRVSQDEHGLPARLTFRLLATVQAGMLSLLVIRLETGRPHQIRVQLAHAGWPIYGDRRYGRQTSGSQQSQDLALFSTELAMKHPIRQERLFFKADPPSTLPWTLFEAGLWTGQTDWADFFTDF